MIFSHYMSEKEIQSIFDWARGSSTMFSGGRISLHEGGGVCSVFQYSNGQWNHVHGISSFSAFSTKEEAMADLDKFLLDRGDVLLTKEQWTKLALLV